MLLFDTSLEEYAEMDELEKSIIETIQATEIDPNKSSADLWDEWDKSLPLLEGAEADRINKMIDEQLQNFCIIDEE